MRTIIIALALIAAQSANAQMPPLDTDRLLNSYPAVGSSSSHNAYERQYQQDRSYQIERQMKAEAREREARDFDRRLDRFGSDVDAIYKRR